MTSSPHGRADVERNRAAIIAAATTLLAARPAASMHDLAAAAGVNRATLYRHFKNRDALITALHRAALSDTEALTAGLPESGPVLPALGDYLADAIDVGERYRFLSIAPRTDTSMFGAEGRAAAPIIAAVQRGQSDGEIDQRYDPVFIAGLLVMLVIGAVGMVEREQMDLPQAIEQSRLALHRALGAPE